MHDLIHPLDHPLVHLSNGTTDVVVDLATGVPTIVHWGAPHGDDADLAATRRALDRPRPNGELDAVAPISIVPEHGSGFHGRPGLAGRRGRGVGWSPRFGPAGEPTVTERTIVAAAEDRVAGLRLVTTIELDDVLRVATELTNIAERRYSLDALTVTLPVPAQAAELLRFDGRWAREFQVQRMAWTGGAILAENRRGRTSHEHLPLLFAGESGFREWSGEVWGVHLAWSGNHTMLAERLDDGRRYIQAGELLHPGEVVLEAGESYSTPEVVATYSGGGLTPATGGYHRSLRARATHPVRPRPVTLSTWEAVYFDHDHERLTALADVAAAVGVERYVLDDGWFGSRRDDTTGLGDWVVSPDVYPDGLAPLIDHVRSHGMEFGIWVEPEMVSGDSDLARQHPEWMLATDGYEPVIGRHQLVLDLGRPAAFDHVLGQLDALLDDHDIAFVKWDMNRAHAQGSGADGAAGTHRQTRALYALLDELRRRHPAVEFESCASGGGRVDHEILRRTERVWTSDCNDALERQQIQRGASMLIPPELMGAHIGPSRSHTTARIHSLAFRGATALFGHLGVEWNIARVDDERLAQLRRIIEIHREHRDLLHTGDVVRFDTDTDACLAHGVYAADRSRGIVSFVQLTTAPSLTPSPLRLPGLDPDRRYAIAHLPLPGEQWGMAIRQPAWLVDGDGLVLTGRQLAVHGIQPPILHPESAILFTITAV
ncbi:MAG: alpha-galactosidase [Ilumatobacteraceae bacterium]